MEVEERLVEQRRQVASIRKAMKNTAGYKEHRKLQEEQRRQEDRGERMKAKAARLRDRLRSVQPTGWPEFVQVVKVLTTAQAVAPHTHNLLPLGETAAALRGLNELWMAVALLDPGLRTLTIPQMAAAAAAVVAEGIKVRPEARSSGGIYEASEEVQQWVGGLEAKRLRLLEWQEEEGVQVGASWRLGCVAGVYVLTRGWGWGWGWQIPCNLDPTFAGLVEAWASGVSWKELMDECGVDEGDVARLLRRTIDTLSQVTSAVQLSAERQAADIVGL